MVPKSIGIGLLFVFSSSALLQQDVSSPFSLKTCCCRETSKTEADCLKDTRKDLFNQEMKGSVYVQFDKRTRNGQLGACCKQNDNGCNYAMGFQYHVTHMIKLSKTPQLVVRPETIQTCEGLSQSLMKSAVTRQQEALANHNARIGGSLARTNAFDCPATDKMLCPPEEEVKGKCKEPHDNMFCKGVNNAVCFITKFQEVFYGYLQQGADATFVPRNGFRIAAQQHMAQPKTLESAKVGPLEKFDPETFKDFDAGVFGDFFQDFVIGGPAFGVVAYTDAASGVFINALKLMNDVCYDTNSNCDRGVRMVSIVVGITSIALSITGAGIPLTFLLNNLVGILNGKLGNLICAKGVAKVFRELIMDPTRELLSAIGDDISKFKDYFVDWKTAVETLVRFPDRMVAKLLKLVSKFILGIVFGIVKLLKKIPLVWGAFGAAWTAAGAPSNDAELKKISDRYHTCCALKAAHDTGVGVEAEVKQQEDLQKLEEDAAALEEEEEIKRANAAQYQIPPVP